MSKTPYLDRARAINERQRKAMTARGRDYVLAVAVPAGLALAFIGGLSMPMDRGRTYELVRFEGTESSVVDFNLSALDCGMAAAQFRAAGLFVRCEESR